MQNILAFLGPFNSTQIHKEMYIRVYAVIHKTQFSVFPYIMDLH